VAGFDDSEGRQDAVLIFDRFPTPVHAAAFIATIEQLLPELGSHLYDDVGDALAADPFPFVLTPPIVHVDRFDDLGIEEEVERLVERFGAMFAGA